MSEVDTDYPFQEDWEHRQAEPLPPPAKLPKRLAIGFHEIPSLYTKETPSDPVTTNQRVMQNTLFSRHYES